MLTFLILYVVVGISIALFMEYQDYREKPDYEFTLEQLLLILLLGPTLTPLVFLGLISEVVLIFIADKIISFVEKFNSIVLYRKNN